MDGHPTEAGVLVPRGVGVVCIISASQKVNTHRLTGQRGKRRSSRRCHLVCTIQDRLSSMESESLLAMYMYPSEFESRVGPLSTHGALAVLCPTFLPPGGAKC